MSFENYWDLLEETIANSTYFTLSPMGNEGFIR